MPENRGCFCQEGNLPLGFSQYYMFFLLENYFFPEIPESRRQDLSPPAYVRNGSIYASTVISLQKRKSRLGEDTRPYIMPHERSINIDEPIDLIVAEHLVKER